MSTPTSDTQSDGQGGEVRLKKSIGLFNGIAMIVGLVVGGGIFVSPVGVLQSAGSVGLSLVFWVIGGLAAGIGSMVYIELGTTFKESGGDYTYIGQAFGPALQMCFVWAYLLVVFPAGNAVMALTFANYALVPFFGECPPPGIAISLLAGFLIVSLTAVNSFNVDWAARLTDVFTILKILTLLAIAISGFVYLGQGKGDNFSDIWADTSTNPVSWARAIYAGVYSYSGWNYLNLITEEVDNAHVTLPRAIWISIPLITVLYLMANVAFMAVLPAAELLQSPAVAVAFGRKLYHSSMTWVYPLLVACSTLGSLNGSVFTSARLYYVAARNGQLPASIGMLNPKYLTPMVSVVFQGVISLFMLVSDDVLALINYATFVETSFIGLTVAAMLYMRKKYPHLPRPKKVSLFFPITYLCFCIFLLVMTLAEGATDSLIAVALVLSAIPVYWVFVCWKNKPKVLLRLSARLTVLMQKVFYSIPEGKDV